MENRAKKYASKIAPDGAHDDGTSMGPAAQEAAQGLVLGTDDLWPKNSAAALSEGKRGKDTTSSSGPRSTATFHDVGTTLRGRTRMGRYGFWLKFWSCLASILWNVASPIKSYVLSFYGLPGDDLVFSHNLNWTMEVDYDYAKSLYDMSGITYRAAEGKPVRFINMYLDFVVFNRARIWAKNLDDFQQDPSVGMFCRASLVRKGEPVYYELAAYCLTNGYFAGNNFLEPTTCRVNEVSEAVMCLKGIDVLALLNYEWTSTLDPTNEYIQQGARLYQDAIFPDLDACLSRRALLVDTVGRDEALQQLTQELATNYSLDATGFAGKKGLYAAYRYYEGFRDLSGKPSGVRYSKMSGSLPERTQPIEPDLNALVAGRERLWWLVGETPQGFRDNMVLGAYFASYMFMGMNINNNATTGRFVDRYMLEKAGTVGICQNWNLVPTSHKIYPDPVYLATSPERSVLSGYGFKYFGPRAIVDNNVTDPVQLGLMASRMTTPCITRDGCLGFCSVVRTGGWVATFDRSGLCQSREVSQSLINRQGFVDWKCFGEGTGKDTFSILFSEPIKRSDNTTFQLHQIKNVSNPGAILACVLGGRVPQIGDEPYPNSFFDLIENGPNTIITSTFSRGTEKVLVNVYALVSFVGCAVFSIWVMQNLRHVTQMLLFVKKNNLCGPVALTQLLDSLFTLNLSTVSHGRNIQLSKVILWLNLVTWYLGAADSNCTWWVNGVDLWTPGVTLLASDSPYYKCKPGQFVEFLDSFIGVVRMVSISYNFYSLTCQHLILRGATRYVLPFLLPIIIFGLLPTFLAATMITGVNHLRLEWGILLDFHNQLFLVVLWIGYLFMYHWILQNEFVGRHLVAILCKLKLGGKQNVTPGSVAEAIIGPYYLTMPGLVREEATEWIPLSVALESPTFDMTKLNFTTRKYSLTNRIKGHEEVAPEIPEWVLQDDEYFFC